MLRVLVLAFALIGFLHVTPQHVGLRVRGVSDGVPIGVSEPEFPLMAGMATGAALASGNRVEVLQNGHGAPGRMADQLVTS